MPINNKLNNIDEFEYISRCLEFEKERESNINNNCNIMIISNSIILIPLVYAFIESLKAFPQVNTLIIIFGFILIGVVLTSIFLSVLSQIFYKTINRSIDDNLNNYLNNVYKIKYKNNCLRKRLLFASLICNSILFILLASFILVVMIVM